MRHTKKKLITLSIYTLFMTALYGGYVGSLSWFVNKSTLPDDFEGESGKAFFGGGDGTSTNPYQINNARHFYNLCWLQYLGRFNKDTDSDGIIDQIYFELTNDIDCSTLGSALPPIGTTRYPFVGNFNGNDHIISNYTITDKYSELTKHPSIIDTEDTYYTKGANTINYCSIIGTFGVIGYNTTGATDVTDDEASLYKFSTSQLKVNSVDNLYIDNVTIKPATKNTLAGLLAGYVSANMSGCGVHYSNLNFSNGNTNISSKFNNKLSNYTLIGDYNSTDYDWDGHSGQNNDFGGSIDMLTFARRISYIKNSATSPNNYHASFGTVTSGGYNWLSSSTYIDLNSGSYLPVNIDMDVTEMTNVSGNKDTTNSYYSSNTEEPVLKTNSGYITGGATRTRVQLCNKDSQGIKNVVKRVSGTSTSNNNMDLFSDSAGKVIDQDKLKTNIGFLTYYNGNIAAIYDDDDKDFVQSDNFIYKIKGSDVETSKKNYVNASNFQKYSSVKNSFLTMIYDSSKAYYDNDGSKTYGVYLAGVRFQQWKTDNTFNANIKWLGENKDVTFHNNGVQFELKKDGYLTAIVSKYDTSGNFSFYNLYSLDSLTDTSLTKINTIHKDSNGNITYNESNESTKIFDFAPITTTDTGLYSGQLYYFEIPIKKGIYFLSSYGSDYTSSYYPYLLYLDIGANAGDSGEDEKEGKLENIDFYYYEDNKLVKVTADNASNVVFDISGDGSAVFYFNRILNIGVLYYDENVNGLTRTQPSTFTGTSVQASDNTCAEAS